MTKKINVLELNNIDIYGKRFNGFSLSEYCVKHPEKGVDSKMLVNHKLGKSSFVYPLFNNKELEIADWKIEELERKLGIKNQISVSEIALSHHPLYESADILHFHMYHNSQFPIEFLTRIPKEKKIILDLHDTFWLTGEKIPMLDVFSFSNKNKKSLDAQRKRVLNSIGAKFIIHSPYMEKLVRESGVIQNPDLKLITFGIDTDVFKPLKNREELRRKKNIEKDEIVLMCRTQDVFKGTEYILAALKKLETDKKIVIMTVNATGMFSEIENKFRVIDNGVIDSEKEMAELFNIADVFLSPSTEESFGFMAVEAMACGKPVIVFKGTALPDTVNAPKIGIATKRSSDELGKAILKLLDSPLEMKKRGKAGRELVLKKYSEKDYLEEHLNFYSELALKDRDITPVAADNEPVNIKSFKKFLKSQKDSGEVFNYNNVEIQNELQKYNGWLYNKRKKRTAVQLAKAIVKKIIINKPKKDRAFK